MGIWTIDRHNTKLHAPFPGLQAGFMRYNTFQWEHVKNANLIYWLEMAAAKRCDQELVAAPKAATISSTSFLLFDVQDARIVFWGCRSK